MKGSLHRGRALLTNSVKVPVKYSDWLHIFQHAQTAQVNIACDSHVCTELSPFPIHLIETMRTRAMRVLQ